MADIYSSEKRSGIMSRVSDKETKAEIIVRKYIFAQGFRYRKNDKRYPGTPDIVLPKYKTIIFVNGCFWHGHHCKAGKLPDTRREFWEDKISTNKERDKRNTKKLKKEGWNVLTVWECEIKSKTDREGRLNKLVTEIKQGNG